MYWIKKGYLARMLRVGRHILQILVLYLFKAAKKLVYWNRALQLINNMILDIFAANILTYKYCPIDRTCYTPFKLTLECGILDVSNFDRV